MIAIGALLVIIRWASVFNPAIVVLNDDITSHISNFAISLIVYTGIGYYWLLAGTKLRYIMMLETAVIAANFFCEFFVTALNTPDLADAFYGTIGTIIPAGFLFVTAKYGLVEVKND
jgi:hypothetical protein